MAKTRAQIMAERKALGHEGIIKKAQEAAAKRKAEAATPSWLQNTGANSTLTRRKKEPATANETAQQKYDRVQAENSASADARRDSYLKTIDQGDFIGNPVNEEARKRYTSQAVKDNVERKAQADPSGSYIKNNAGTITGWKPGTGSGALDFVTNYSPYSTSGSSTDFSQPTNNSAAITEAYYNQFKDQLGDTFSDEAIRAMAEAQTQKMTGNQQLVEAQKQFLAQQQQAREEELARKEAEFLAREQSLMSQNERDLDSFTQRKNEQYQIESDRARQESDITTSTSERLLGAQGRLTTMPGSQDLIKIEEQLSETLSSIEAKKQAEIALYKAQQDGATGIELEGLYANLNSARDRASQEKGVALENLLLAEQAAIEAGNETQAAFLNDMISAATVEDPPIDIEKSQEFGVLMNPDGTPYLDGKGGTVDMPSNFASGGIFEANGRKYQSIYDKATGSQKVIDLGQAKSSYSGSRSSSTSPTSAASEVIEFVEDRREQGFDDLAIMQEVQTEYPGTSQDASEIKRQVKDYVNATTKSNYFDSLGDGVGADLARSFYEESGRPNQQGYYTFDNVYYGGSPSGGGSGASGDDSTFF